MIEANTISRLPAHFDGAYLLAKLDSAGVRNHAGFTIDDDTGELVLRYRAESYDAVQAVLAAYATEYTPIWRERILKEAAALRWARQQTTTFNGHLLLCDLDTINLVDATRNSMIDAPDSPQTCLWKAGPTHWATFDADGLLQMGLAIRAHVQACFVREKEIQDAALAATTVDELAAIDLAVGWPE